MKRRAQKKLANKAFRSTMKWWKRRLGDADLIIRGIGVSTEHPSVYLRRCMMWTRAQYDCERSGKSWH